MVPRNVSYFSFSVLVCPFRHRFKSVDGQLKTIKLGRDIKNMLQQWSLAEKSLLRNLNNAYGIIHLDIQCAIFELITDDAFSRNERG